MNGKSRRAAETLHQALEHHPWFTAVGTGPEDGLIVYVTGSDRETRQQVPDKWEGYLVTVHKTSRPILG